MTSGRNPDPAVSTAPAEVPYGTPGVGSLVVVPPVVDFLVELALDVFVLPSSMAVDFADSPSIAALNVVELQLV